jgi:hypothetical protein
MHLIMASVYVVYHSGYGHTKLQAEAVHRGAASVADTRAEIRTTGEATANLDELDNQRNCAGFISPVQGMRPMIRLDFVVD